MKKNNMMEAIVIGIVALVFLFAFSTPIANGIHGLRTDEIEQSQVVVTGGGVTTAAVVLTDDLFLDRVAEVHEITSTIVESPVATTYVPGTNTLTITNLTAAETRTLTITYYTEVTDQFMAIVGPFLNFFVFGGILSAIAWGVWKQS